MIPVITKIGSYFRKVIGAETGISGRHLCGLCGEPTDPTRRRWSSDRHSYIDEECIPAYIRNLGAFSVQQWLDGDFGRVRL